jgi:hypothetical protein
VGVDEFEVELVVRDGRPFLRVLAAAPPLGSVFM